MWYLVKKFMVEITEILWMFWMLKERSFHCAFLRGYNVNTSINFVDTIFCENGPV